MAENDGSKRLAAVRPLTVSTHFDQAAARLDYTFLVARAIADALKVLTALERTTEHSEYGSGLITGDGHASGYTVIDDTMPDLAMHLHGLIEQMEQDAQTIREEYESLVKTRAEAANG